MAPVIEQIRAGGVTSLRGVAAVLNARGVRTARGGHWAATQVGSILARTGMFNNGAKLLEKLSKTDKLVTGASASPSGVAG